MEADFLVTGRIYSFDTGGAPFASMLIRDGRVAALSREPLPCSVPRLDLGDQIVIPAFVDSHVHLLELGLLLIMPDLGQAVKLADVFDALSAARGQAIELGFLMAFNLEPGNLRERRMPSRCELDNVIPGLPVLVYRIDGHSASLNSQGLQMVFDREIPDGAERDEFGAPTGLLASAAYEQASRAFKHLLPRELKLTAFDRAARKASQHGVLTVGAFVGSDELGDDMPELLRDYAARLPVETVVYPQTRNIKRAQAMGSSRIGGCILIDGSFGSHTAALLADYSDLPGNQGNLYFGDAELEAFLSEADAAGLQTAVHTIGDRAVGQVVSCYEHFLTGNPLRHRIEHAELLNAQLIERIARLGIILGVQPAFEHFWGGPGRMYERRLGVRFRDTNPYRQLADRGVALSGGSDAPITPVDPALGIRSAVTHPVIEHRLTPLEACRLFTDRAAFALGCDTRKGSLEVGCDADFLVLDNSPIAGPDFRILKRFRAGREVT
jgi:predicted amidohydrolase YtcJ